MPREPEFKEFKTDEAMYALVINDQSGESWTYMPAIQVGEIQAIPNEMTLRKLQESEYMAFETTVAAIGQSWQEAEEYLKSNSDFERNYDRYSYEFYPPHGAETDVSKIEAWLCIPVKAR